ncbi:MAG: hypothetical protein LC775_01085 [Acidobacteria bacterium]|nr:hypothetical protein [Acidobacteriota bacterium]
MSAPVWQAVNELAAIWRSSSYVQTYSARLTPRSTHYAVSGHHIEAQPFYQSIYLPTTMDYEQSLLTPEMQEWLHQSELLGQAYTTLIEWLRSRLGGYPFLGAPQLTRTSPWTILNVSMRVPWLVEFRCQQLQNRTTPPVIPFLKVDPASQLQAGTRLGDAIASSPAGTQVDKATMRTSSYQEPDDHTGSDDFRKLHWSEIQLDAAVRSLTGQARVFADALTAADRLIQQTAALFSHLVIYEKILRLDNIVLVEQLDGASGWYTVRSDSYTFPPVRQFEILTFDHPYPRGAMLVSGIREEFMRHAFATTVHGRILPDSEDLTA